MALPRFGRCVIVAAGASAAAAAGQVRQAHQLGWPVIAINESWRLAPYAEVLYACDAAWWWRRGPRPDEFPGRRYAGEPGAPGWVQILEVFPLYNEMVLAPEGVLGAGGNSGFQAVNLAIQAGARNIVLVGFDYGGEHWHGRHGPGLNNPHAEQLAEWAQILDARAASLAALGIQIIDTSPAGRLTAFRKLPLQAALNLTEPDPWPS